MPLEEGTKRDIAVIRGIRDAVGRDAEIMIDANNGYNLNLTKEVLLGTRDVNLFWIEEAFMEDEVLYAELKSWMSKEGLNVLIADGEGYAAPPLVEWAKRGTIDIIQYDIQEYGYHRWMKLGKELDSYGVRSAPHNYNSAFGNYASAHLAASLSNFLYVEWDEIDVPGLDASAFIISEGALYVPELPGFGLMLDETFYENKVRETGWIAKTE